MIGGGQMMQEKQKGSSEVSSQVEKAAKAPSKILGKRQAPESEDSAQNVL